MYIVMTIPGWWLQPIPTHSPIVPDLGIVVENSSIVLSLFLVGSGPHHWLVALPAEDLKISYPTRL
jgi:hypothetical protein